MKNRKLTSLLAAFMVLLLFACDKDKDNAQRRMKLQSVGFSGTMPNGWQFGKTGIVLSNGIEGGNTHTIDGTYLESHISQDLGVSDTTAGLTIRVCLPQVQYKDENLSTKDLKVIARKYYTYQTVKQKLAIGDKLLVTLQNSDYSNGFWFQVLDDKKYDNYLSTGPDQTGSYLKVIDLIESTEPDPVLGPVRTLEVIFDLDVKVYQASALTAPPPKKIKGLPRIKYREI